MELIKVLLVTMMLFVFGCTDSSSSTKNTLVKGTGTASPGSKPAPKKGETTDQKTTPGGGNGSTQNEDKDTVAPQAGEDSEDREDDDEVGSGAEVSKTLSDKKVTISGASAESADAKATQAIDSKATQTAMKPTPDTAPKTAGSVTTGTLTDLKAVEKTDEKKEAADAAAKTASLEQLKALKTVVATLNAAHLQLVNKTERQFNIAKNAISNTLLKEISTYLARHLDRTGTSEEKLVQYAGDCAHRETKKRSKIGFRGTGDSLELNLYLASCESKDGVKAASIRLRPSQNSFELQFFNDNLSSTSVAWVQLISNEGRCVFYHKPGPLGADALVQMDCGETRGKCGSEAVDKLPSFKGIAVSIPSARAGVTEIAMFERFYQYNETQGSEHFPKKFYSCAHRFEQKRTECTSDCLERKVTTVMILKDDKYHVNPDYLNDTKRAFEKAERERKAQESRDAVEAVQKQAAAAAAKPKTPAELSAEHQAALKLQQQQQGAADPAAEQAEPVNPEDLTTDGSAQYPQANAGAPKPVPAAPVKPAVKARSELTREELDLLSPEQLELAEEADRKNDEAGDSIP